MQQEADGRAIRIQFKLSLEGWGSSGGVITFGHCLALLPATVQAAETEHANIENSEQVSITYIIYLYCSYISFIC